MSLYLLLGQSKTSKRSCTDHNYHNCNHETTISILDEKIRDKQQTGGAIKLLIPNYCTSQNENKISTQLYIAYQIKNQFTRSLKRKNLLIIRSSFQSFYFLRFIICSQIVFKHYNNELFNTIQNSMHINIDFQLIKVPLTYESHRSSTIF